jgi:glucokinase
VIHYGETVEEGTGGAAVILAGDIGGTNTRLALLEAVDGRLRPRAEGTYRSAQHADLHAVLEHFRREHAAPITAAGFGVAGPVVNGRCEATNLPWVVDAAALARHLDLEGVSLINDLQAIAEGSELLGEEEFRVLQAGQPGVPGNRAIIAAGTGLGEAGLFWDGRRHQPFATEGGHVDFAPRTPMEAELLHHLRTRFGRVSYERVVSGRGLLNIYHFLRESGRGETPAEVLRAMEQGDPGAVITRSALEGRCGVCRQALDLFVSVYGAEAGNLALKMLAVGGVLVAGGIAPHILEKLADGDFIEAFRAKGRLTPLLEAIPVRVILNQRVGVLGAARTAVEEVATFRR